MKIKKKMKTKITTRTLQSIIPGTKAYDIRDTELPGFLIRVPPSGNLSYFCDFRRPDGRRTRIKQIMVSDANTVKTRSALGIQDRRCREMPCRREAAKPECVGVAISATFSRTSVNIR
jgi:hypothetical protein